MQGNALNKLRKYLANPYQFLSKNNTTSSLLKIECGALHRSILETILFPSYINDLPKVSTNRTFLSYAADINTLYKGSYTKTIIKSISMEIPKITEWPKLNKLHINIDNTVDILSHTRQKRFNMEKQLGSN